MNKRIITLIIALAAVCGCQKTEKTIYKVPLSEHAMELERQERAYNDSLEKYSALLDTAQIQCYFDLHKAVLDTLGVVMRQEAEAIMAAKDREAANKMTYTRKSCHFRSQKESDNEAQDKNRARV